MKNLIKSFAVLLFLSISINLNAQIKIGPKIGVHIANWNIDENEIGDTDSKLGFQLGIAAEFIISESVTFQPELLFLQKGFKLNFSDEGGYYGYNFIFEIENEATINYLEIPLLFKGKFGSETGPKFFILAGPSIGYGLNGEIESKETTTTNGVEEIFESTDDLDWDDDEINRLDLGLGFGAGVEIAAGAGDILFEARYLLGVTELNKDGDDISIKNTGFGFALTYLFPFGETK